MGRWSLEVLSTQGKDRERWERYIEALPSEKKDIYFLPEYAAIYEDELKEPASLLRYGDSENGALMVLVKRSVAGLPFLESADSDHLPEYHDVSSPFGYGGPVVHSQDGSLETDLFAGFRESMHKYCLDNGIVAEFLRLHPLMENHRYFGQDSGLYQKNSTVWIDLSYSESEILQRMKNDPRRCIRIATDEGVEVILSDFRLDHLKEFHHLYTENMERLNSISFYMFSLEFFQGLVSSLRDNMALFLARWKGKTVAAYLFFHCGKYVDLYLAGSDKDHWKLKANVLTLYKAALWAKAQGYSYYHIGGGHAVEVDSLFHFKSQFSPDRALYYMYRQVHDQQAYERLCKMKQEYDLRVGTVDESEKDPVLVNYFPAYRG